jgi:site-specific DNA-cytosine methylase
MKFLSVCSGIEAASVAWHPLGWESVAYSEIEPFPCKVLAQPIPFDTTQITSKANYSKPQSGDPCHPLAAGAHPPAIAQAMAVRRLTPVECERLQGFPDRYTDIQPKGKATPDGPRYKALGNSMAVPVMAWIGKRIQEVDAICKTQQNT